jgi:meso-butanediol dehydrogenase / (S,S)-butanediol dehydrogenase / diacetyl reductase
MLTGKSALITGATSGIGWATAQLLAQNGAQIIATGRNDDKGQQLLSSLSNANHHFVPADLSNSEQAQNLVGKALALVPRIDILINSAGVALHASVPQSDDDLWRQTMTINLDAVFYISRSILPIMAAQGGGVIVNVASTWGLVGAEQSAAYCASKGAVVQLTRCMALDHALQNIRINAVCPGAVDTPMLASEAAAFDISVEDGRSLWAQDAANKKLAKAKDIANSILFLCSDNASHIHGVALPVDGGSIAS